MTGFRTPSWFRVKGRLKVEKIKVQNSKPKARKPKKGK